MTLAFLTSAGYGNGSGSTPAVFDLLHSAHTLSDSRALINRGIRSGYAKEDLLVTRFALASCEIRWHAASFTIPPSFACRIQPFIYGDIARTEKGSEGITDDAKLLNAFGCGVRILIDNPIFAYFSFSYGINYEKKALFAFSAKAGF